MKHEYVGADTYETAFRRLSNFKDIQSLEGIQSFADLFPVVQNVGSDLRALAQVHGAYNDYEGMWSSAGTVQTVHVLGQEVPEVYYHFFTNRAISQILVKHVFKKDLSDMFPLLWFHIPHKLARYSSDTYLKHSHRLPGFEAVKFRSTPQLPYPDIRTYPFDHFRPDVCPENPSDQQNYITAMQEGIGVVLEGIRKNPPHNVTKSKENTGLVSLEPYQLYMVSQR